MAVGLADKKKIFYSKAKGINKPVVYVGSKTGRDGIHGASMASAEFSENSEDQPFENHIVSHKALCSESAQLCNVFLQLFPLHNGS